MEQGKFIVFEGIDGSGKSTQLKRLYSYLTEQRNLNVVVTREPSDREIGTLLRSYLSGEKEGDERAIAALFAADRLDHVFGKGGIKETLERGVSVLCDRYVFSSLAYNGGMLSLEWVEALNKMAMEGLKADLTIFIDISPEDSMRRILKRGHADRYETAERQTAVRESYLRLFETFGGENVVTVKSDPDKEVTQGNIRRAVDDLYGF